MDAAALRDLLGKLAVSLECEKVDLIDPITLLAATGLRRSELLALRWSDFDEVAGTIAVSGKIARIEGQGLKRLDSGKTASAERVVALPRFAIDALTARRSRPFWGEHPMIFPSTAGTWRDADNFDKQWRKVRDSLGVPDVTSHSFRKTVATLIDEGPIRSGRCRPARPRQGVDDPGPLHAPGKVNAEVADLLDRTINDE